MKIKKILYTLLLIFVITTICIPDISYAHNQINKEVVIYDGNGGGSSVEPEDSESNDSEDSSVTGNSSTGLPDLDDSYRPSVTMPSGGKVNNIIVTILNILTTLGVIAVVISIALIGFGTILGSASEKAHNQEKYVGLIIASLLLTGGSVIVKLIISVAEKI